MDKTSKLKRIIASCLAAISIATFGIAAIATDGFRTFGKHEHVQLEQSEENNGGAVLNTENSQKSNMSLTAVKLSSTDYEEYGVSPLSDSAYTLTATITPSTAANQEADWSVSFKNASSTWVSGKTATDYVTVTPTSDGALTATVACKAAFGEQIIVRVTSRDNKNASATCTVDYAKKVTNFSFVEFIGTDKLTSATTLRISNANGWNTLSYNTDFAVSGVYVNTIYSIYTIDDAFTYSYYIASTSQWTDNLTSSLSLSSMTDSISSTITTTPEQLFTEERPNFLLGRYTGANVFSGSKVMSVSNSFRTSKYIMEYLTALNAQETSYSNYPILYFYVRATGEHSSFTQYYPLKIDLTDAKETVSVKLGGELSSTADSVLLELYSDLELKVGDRLVLNGEAAEVKEYDSDTETYTLRAKPNGYFFNFKNQTIPVVRLKYPY